MKFAEDHVEDTDHVEETSSLEEPNEDSQKAMEDRARMSEEDDSHSDSGEDLSPQHSPTPPATDPSPILLSPIDPVFDPTTDDPDDVILLKIQLSKRISFLSSNEKFPYRYKKVKNTFSIISLIRKYFLFSDLLIP